MKKQGFTLIEIMLVVIIIGVLLAMVAPNLAGKSEKARITAAKSDIESNLSSSLDLYELDIGRYPTTEQGVPALITGPQGVNNWNGPYLKKKKIPQDPWKHDYVYVFPGTHNKDGYDLSSLGKDGVESADDIVNWEEKSSE